MIMPQTALTNKKQEEAWGPEEAAFLKQSVGCFPGGGPGPSRLAPAGGGAGPALTRCASDAGASYLGAAAW